MEICLKMIAIRKKKTDAKYKLVRCLGSYAIEIHFKSEKNYLRRKIEKVINSFALNI